MAIRVLINGANGKMGQPAVKTIENDPDFVLVGQTGRAHDLAAEIKNTKAEVVLDLTNAESVLKNIKTIITAGVHPVIGTSGLLKDHIDELQKECAHLKLGGIIAPNFSIGAILMMKYAKEMAKYYKDVEIIEMHHAGKLDSPSGTAIRTAELLSMEYADKEKVKNTKETIPGARGATYQNIPIHSIRLPGMVAHQEVIFGGLGETLRIRHDSIDRQCFMPGIRLACKKVVELKNLVYGLEQVIF